MHSAWTAANTDTTSGCSRISRSSIFSATGQIGCGRIAPHRITIIYTEAEQRGEAERRIGSESISRGTPEALLCTGDRGPAGHAGDRRGTYEAIYPYEEQVAVIANEEGKLLDLPYNRPLLDEHGIPYDIVCGTFFVAGLSGETFTSLTEDQLRCYKELFDNHIVLTVPAQSQPEKTHPKKGEKYER